MDCERSASQPGRGINAGRTAFVEKARQHAVDRQRHLLVLLTRGEYGENTFYEATVTLIGCTITGLPPLDWRSKTTFCRIIGRIDFRNPDEGPQRAFFG